MPTPDTELFTRGEVLAGLPARRAQAALFIIESRTAQQVARSGQALDPYLSKATASERDLAFVEAFALGKEPPVRPTIQDLEHYVGDWRELVPETPRVRAALAKLLGEKYRFTESAVPGIRAALGLEQAAVASAYEKLYGRPLAMIYASHSTPTERLRWAWAGLARWFDNLPPFWAVFALTLTETVGVCILALPIALAGIGPLPGIVLLVLLGLVNVLTIIAMAEAVTRNGAIRYGHGFLSRMVEDYLGPSGARILWVGNIGWDVIGLLVFCLGFATTLAAVTGVHAVAWATILLLIALFFLRQESLNATFSTALVVGGINLVLLFFLSAAAFTKLDPNYLRHMDVPLLQGRPLDVAILGLIFGTILGAYAAHPSVGMSGKFVLNRDPGGRSLIWGVVAAQVVAILFYSVWVLAVNGAVAPETLARETGTALIPLGAVVGPAAQVVGSIYVVLAMTIGTVYCALRLFSLVRERLPRQSEPIVRLPCRRARLVLRTRTGKPTVVLSLTYLGLAPGAPAGRPRFRVDAQQGETLRRVVVIPADRWDDTMLRSQWPQLDRRVRLSLTVQAATRESALVQLATSLAVRYEGEWDTTGVHAAELLELPVGTRHLLTWLMRRDGATAQEIGRYLTVDRQTAQAMLTELVEQGLLVTTPQATSRVELSGRTGGDPLADGAVRYTTQLAFRRRCDLPDDIWQALDGEVEKPGEQKVPTGRHGLSMFDPTPFLGRLGPRMRFLLAASPTVAVFVAAVVLLRTGTASFSGLLSFIGVVAASLLAGVFPVLLLAASRKKGEFVPAMAYRLLGQPWLLGGIYLLFIASIFLHGLVIWQDPIQRAAAVVVGLVMAGATWTMVRHGAFAGRVVVEIRRDGAHRLQPAPAGACTDTFTVTALGKPIAATLRLVYNAGEQIVTAASGDLPRFDDLRKIVVDLPPAAARDLKIWAHQVTPDGLSDSLPVTIEARCGEASHSVDLRLTDGQVVLPWTGTAGCVTLCFDSVDEDGAPAIRQAVSGTVFVGDRERVAL